MKREWTNRIRYLMDEFLPPIVRDNRWFMMPFFQLAYGRLDVSFIMNFKSRIYQMSDEEYSLFYEELGGSVSRRRITDLNLGSLKWIENSLSSADGSVLDVGCGNGYLLQYIGGCYPRVVLAGVDVIRAPAFPATAQYRKGLLPALPFQNQEFDTVICTHVLEHVTDLQASVDELLRVTRHKLLIVVPRQRYYYYTLDEHINFFWDAGMLVRLFHRHKVDVQLINGDWCICITAVAEQ